MTAARPVRRGATPGAASRGRPQAPGRQPVWLLDLDNTLHDAMPHVFPRINTAMTDYVSRHLGLPPEQASELRVRYWQRYGATMLGLIRHHGIDPHHFLRETHPFPDLHAIVSRDHGLRDALRRLPGRKIVVTNAPNAYAAEVLRRLGVSAQIHGLVAIESMRVAGRYFPKPSRSMLARIVARLRLPPSRCILVEDSVANLASARACRLRTVLVTGLSHRAHGPLGRPRAGAGRRIDVQVPSAWLLPRVVHRLLR
ncbi:MAG: pyrimidine 5'-nucleotidase [Gammaproteobacteria bacterium]